MNDHSQDAEAAEITALRRAVAELEKKNAELVKARDEAFKRGFDRGVEELHPSLRRP